MASASVEPATGADTKPIGAVVRSIRTAWSNKDYTLAVSESRALLEREPANTYGLIYLARAAAYTGDWADVVIAGAALVRESPRDAFNAARKLSHEGRTLEAARIFADLDVGGDWFDAELAEMASKEAVSLLKAGQNAERNGDPGLAKTCWVAGARIAPRSLALLSHVSQLASEAKKAAHDLDRDSDPLAYIDAWREVLWLEPSNVLAATKLAWACERLDPETATDAWLKVLAIAPDFERAEERLRHLAARNDLEDRAIRGLVELGRDESADPLILALVEGRELKARESRESAAKTGRRDALARAGAIDREADPRQYLAAWKAVLALDPTHQGAARKIVSVARELGDYPELVEALIALLEIAPGDAAVQERLAGAAQRAGKEQRALEYLARHGLAELPAEKLQSLRKRVLNGCKRALADSAFDLALTHFRTLELAGADDPSLEALRSSLVRKAASGAREAEKQGELRVAVSLADQVLEIVPDHPVALRIVARDLLRQRRYADVVALCGPRMSADPEYESVRKLVERASEKLAS
jgi:hypothetical protein